MTIRGTFLLCAVGVLLLLPAASAPANDFVQLGPSPDIVNGDPVPSNSLDWGFNVALLSYYDPADQFSKYEFQYCSGTLVRPKWVLTASNCAPDLEFEPAYAVVDAIDLTAPVGEVLEVVGVRGWRSGDIGPDHGLVLLELERPAQRGTPISLETESGAPAASAAARIAGWGLDEDLDFPTVLQEADVDVFSDSACSDMYPSISTAAFFCAGHVDDSAPRDTCVGDLGAPLVTDTVDGPRLAGVAMNPSSCTADDKFGNFARIAPLASWIEWASNPGLTFTQSSVSFGSLLVGGGEFDTRMVTLTNTGGGMARVGAISFAGAAYELQANNCSQGELEPGASCELWVNFKPVSEGLNASELVVATNRNDADAIRLPLSGTGVVPGSPTVRMKGRPFVFKARKGPRIAVTYSISPDLRGMPQQLMDCGSDASVSVKFRGLKRTYRARTRVQRVYSDSGIAAAPACTVNVGINIPTKARRRKATFTLNIEPGPYFPTTKFSRTQTPKWFKVKKRRK